MNPITLSWLLEVGIITWRSVKRESRPPIPSELLATFVAFGSLTIIGNNASWQRAASLTAGGLVLATLLNFFDPATGKPYVSASGGGGAKMAKDTPTGTPQQTQRGQAPIPGSTGPSFIYHGGI